MKRTILILSLTITIGASIAWLALGANRGWTKTSVPVKTMDEITGIEGIEYQRRFVPGLEALGSALLGAGLLATSSIFFHNKKTQIQK